MNEIALKELEEDIELSWERYKLLQEIHEAETGKEWEWLK